MISSLPFAACFCKRHIFLIHISYVQCNATNGNLKNLQESQEEDLVLFKLCIEQKVT